MLQQLNTACNHCFAFHRQVGRITNLCYITLHDNLTRNGDISAGLEGGHTNQPAIFTVETRGAGQGGLGLAIEGPSEAKMNCRDNRDGSCTVEYLPTKPGDYDIAIKFADRPIPGEYNNNNNHDGTIAA